MRIWRGQSGIKLKSVSIFFESKQINPNGPTQHKRLRLRRATVAAILKQSPINNGFSNVSEATLWESSLSVL